MKPNTRKNKGRKLQQHVARKLVDIFGLDEGDCESRSMGASGTDVVQSPKARRVIGISMECKNTQGTPSLSEVKQSQANKYPDTLAAVVWKPKGARYDDSLIVFNLEEFAVAWRDRKK